MFWGWKRRALQAEEIACDQQKVIEALRKERDALKDDRALRIANARKREKDMQDLIQEREGHLKQISSLADVGDELKARADQIQAQLNGAEAELAEAKAELIRANDSRARHLREIATLLTQAQELMKIVRGQEKDWTIPPGCCGSGPCGPIELTIEPVCEAEQDLTGQLTPGEVEALPTQGEMDEAAEAALRPAEAACEEDEEGEPFDADEDALEETQDGRLFPAELSDPVVAAGLTLQRCSPHHFKILGGKVAVDFWPYSKRGFTVAVDGGKGMRGHTIESAIALARGAK